MGLTASAEELFLATYSIGLKLRTLRNESRLTLSRLAAETGLSTALLSKLETNRMIPTLATLARICRVYGVGLSYFFADVQEHTLAITRRAHTLDSHRGDALKEIPLHLPSVKGRILAKVIEFPPNLTTHAFGSRGQTDVVIFVLVGALRLNFTGAQEVLGTGDCAVLTTDDSVMWGAADASHCRALVVTNRPDTDFLI